MKTLKATVVAFFLFLLFPTSALAICPVCTVAVAAGLGLSRWLGIDDSVSGIWIGGLILSSSFWLIDWLEKKNFKKPSFYYKFRYKNLATIALMYALVILPLWPSGIIGHPFNTIAGMDKLLFGILVGSGAFLVGMWADKKVRKIKGKQLFSFQKVAFPVASLAIASLVVYFYGGYLY